jgi:hypothetical protein
MQAKAGGRGLRAIAFLGAAFLLAAAMGPLATSTPAPPGGTHAGYVDKFANNAEQVPPNWVAVQGPANAWRVSGNTLQAVQVPGTLIELLDPNVPIDILGDRLLGLCFLPEQTINSLFYSGFTVNEAPLVELLLGTGLDALKLRINIPLQQLQVLDTANNLLGQVNLGKLVQFNQWTCLNAILTTDPANLLVLLGNTLDSVGHVVNGVPHQLPLQGLQGDLPGGSLGLAQPVVNSARVLFRDLHLQTTPDVPRAVEAFAGPADGQITLTWAAPAANGGVDVATYNVYRGTSPDFAGMELVGTVFGYDTEFVDQAYQGIVPSTQEFYYRITAVNHVGEGPLSFSACRIPYPMGLLLVDNSGLGCGSHGLVAAPMLQPVL